MREWRNPGGVFPSRTLCSLSGTSGFSPDFLAFVAGVGDAFFSPIRFGLLYTSLHALWGGRMEM